MSPRLSPVGCSAEIPSELSGRQSDNLVEEIYVAKQSITKGLKIDECVDMYLPPPPDEFLEKDDLSSISTNEEKEDFVERVIVNVDSNIYPEKIANYDVVVSIDIGTTFTGYAFAYTNKPNDKQIHMMRQSEGGDRGLNNQKVPSILLLTPEKKFHSFGLTARDSYHDMDQEEATMWLYFDKFKMNIQNNAVSGETIVRAQNGVAIPALTVFSETLRYLKNQVYKELADSKVEIRWVLTIPALWTHQDNQLLRQAAYQAGIGSSMNPEHVLIVLEPEAAAACCRHLHFNQIIEGSLPTKPGAYMVVDCGGGTIDITTHTMGSKSGKELHKATGGPFGSLGIDSEFCKLLEKVFGRDFIMKFKKERPAAYNELMLSFESRKRSASPTKQNCFNIFPPYAFIDYFRQITGQGVETAVKKYNRPDLTWSNEGILKIKPSLMQELFQPTINKIIEHIDAILNTRNSEDIGYLFLVGGFSESQILQHAIKDHFSHRLKIVIPQALSLCVLKGGVLFGIDPLMVTSRKITHSYGLGVVKPFIHGIHPLEKLVVRGGERWCVDVFERMVESGQSVPIGEIVSRKYTPASSSQNQIVLHIYSTLSNSAQFITEPNVYRCGTIKLKLPQENHATVREITVSLAFGANEVTAFAIDSASGLSAQTVVTECTY